MILPLSKPEIATSLAMSGVAVPRRLRRGTCCSTDIVPCGVRVEAVGGGPSDRTKGRPTFSPIAGADRSSEFNRVRHSSRPVGLRPRSRRHPCCCRPRPAPPPAPGPADIGIFSFLTQRWRPVSSDAASTSPVCEALRTPRVVDRRPEAPGAAPIASCRRRRPRPRFFFTGRVAGNLTRVAGGSTSLSLLQPAAINSAARAQRKQ